MLSNPVYTGRVAWGKRRTEKVPGKDNEYRLVKQDEYILSEVISHETFVSKEDFDKVQEIPVVFYVNSETGNVVSVSFDAQNALQAISDFAYESVEGTKGYEDKKRLVADKYEVKINVYDIDNVSKTEIPAEALNGTKLDDIIANPTENSGTAE